jgi:hypothetical protein
MQTRPASDVIKRRALDMVEEAMAYPEEHRERLIDNKRAAIEALINDPDAAIIEKYYEGWTVEDLKTLLTFLPKPTKGKEAWRL